MEYQTQTAAVFIGQTLVIQKGRQGIFHALYGEPAARGDGIGAHE